MIPANVLAALDKLNGHARAWGCGKKAIYNYKLVAALQLAHAGELEVRPVRVHLKCRSCSGTMIYRDWDGYERGRCYRCHNGYVRLRFAETKVGNLTWHHPWNDGGSEIIRTAWKAERFDWRPDDTEIVVLQSGETRELLYESAGDWAPNRPGEKLIGEAAAAQLNVVEDWVAGLHVGYAESRWKVERAQQEMMTYPLAVGRIGNHCHYCGSTEIKSGQAHITRLLEWSLPTCEAHTRMPVAEWDQVAPLSAVTPAVEAWLNRRGWERWQPIKFERAAEIARC